MNLLPSSVAVSHGSVRNEVSPTSQPRRRCGGLAVCAALALLAAAPGLRANNEYGFDYQELQYRAKNLASKPFEKQPTRVPDWLLPPKINYDQHRDIRPQALDRLHRWRQILARSNPFRRLSREKPLVRIVLEAAAGEAGRHGLRILLRVCMRLLR